jgi:NDP-sugar pyrophosphorylase family protein
MKWYASWGHDDFIICLSYKAESVKEYFLNYVGLMGLRGMEASSASGYAEAFVCRKLSLLVDGA